MKLPTDFETEYILVAFEQTGKKLVKTATLTGFSVEEVRLVVTGQIGSSIRTDIERVKGFSKGRPYLDGSLPTFKGDSSNRTEALRLRKEGKTLQEVGDQLGLTRERVRQLTLMITPGENGIPPRGKSVPKYFPKRLERAVAILELGQDKTLSGLEIARRLGISPAIVFVVLNGKCWKDLRPDLARREKRFHIQTTTFSSVRAEIYQLLLEEDLPVSGVLKRFPEVPLGTVVSAIYPSMRGLCPCCRERVGKGVKCKPHKPDCAVAIWQSRGRFRHHKGNNLKTETLSPEEVKVLSSWVFERRTELGLSLNQLAVFLEQVGWKPLPCKSGSINNYERGVVKGKARWELRKKQFEEAFELARIGG